jgi:hypothetical protein
VIGRPGRSSCSFPNATSEPANEIDPTTAENIVATPILADSASTGGTAVAATWYSDAAISAAAPPPTPLNSATICGIAVIRTRCAETAPIAVPMAMPTAIQPYETTRSSASVATIATSMPTAATTLPRRAVRGVDRNLRPRMKNTAATR